MVVCICLLSIVTVCAEEKASNLESGKVSNDWPRTIKIPEVVVVVYKSQLELLDGSLPKGSAAVAVEIKDTGIPRFKPGNYIFYFYMLNIFNSICMQCRGDRSYPVP